MHARLFGTLEYLTGCPGAMSTYVKKIKIAIGDDVLSNSWFCLVNWQIGKFGPRPGGG